MSKKSSENLFELIQSLTKSEKRYFKQFASRHTIGEKNKVIVLFDSIEKQKVYNEKDLISKQISRAQLPDLKIHLYKTILRALNLFHANANAYSQLKNALISVRILFEKGLYDQCSKLIEKAKGTAIKLEYTLILLELKDWEKEVIEATSFIGRTRDDIRLIYKEEPIRLLNAYKKNMEYSFLLARIFKEIKEKGFTRSKKELGFSDEAFNRFLSARPPENSMTNSIGMNAIKSIYYAGKGNYRKSKAYTEKMIKELELNPHFIKENPQSYITALNNIIVFSFNLPDYDNVPNYLEKLEKVKTNSARLNSEISHLVKSRQLSYYLNMQMFEKALESIDRYSTNETTIPNKEHRLTWLYNSACLFMVLEDYIRAKEALYKIITEAEDNFKNDLLSFARILNLIVHYEMKDVDSLEHALKSAYRFLSKRNRLYHFENILLKFLSSTIDFNKKEMLAAFKNLKLELLPLTRHRFEKQAFEFFDFISWLDSKIENKPLIEVIRVKRN